jgi:hypothetical protein
VLPYPFYNNSIGAGAGAAFVAEGYVQKRMLSVGTALASTEGTYLVFLLVRNCQFPLMKRLVLDLQGSVGEFDDVRSYTGANPSFPDERPGDNDSRKENYIEAGGDDSWAEFVFRYVLPIGAGRDSVFPRARIADGVFVEGDNVARRWNPFESGRTCLEVKPFFRKQSFDDEGGTEQKTAGVEFAVEYDNTDFRANPSGGSWQRAFISRDWGALDSTAPWTVVGFEFAKYFSLGPGPHARQRVLGFNFWTVDCLTWDSSHYEGGERVFHRPPTYRGANLGGLWRLKGYPATRFNDRSALYYGLEYRHTLVWNPLKDFTLGGRLDVDWFQLVGLGELGRVAPDWELDEFHSDMKWTLGAGLRVMANHVVLRADLGISEEETLVQLFIGHPF